jgi:hypothetical protein
MIFPGDVSQTAKAMVKKIGTPSSKQKILKVISKILLSG